MTSQNNSNRPAMRIDNRNLTWGDNEALRSVLAAAKVRMLLARSRG